MKNDKKYNIGVLIGGVHTYFPKEHIRGISDAAKEFDANVYFFLGTQTKNFFEDMLDEIHNVIRCCEVTLDNLWNLCPNLVVNIQNSLIQETFLNHGLEAI